MDCCQIAIRLIRFAVGLRMDLFKALEDYESAFRERPAIFGLSLSDEKLIKLIEAALRRGSPLTDKELADGAGVEEAPPGAIL